MRRIGDVPIKQKLVIIIMITTTAALLLAGIGIVLTDSLLFRRFLERDLSALARIIADNSTAALSFNDPKVAQETLGSLRAKPHVASACIYQPDGKILAAYTRQSGFRCPPPNSKVDVRVTRQDVIVSQPIVLNGQQIGTLMLQYDLDEIPERFMLYGRTVFGVLVASSLLAFLPSSELRNLIATPCRSSSGP